VLINKKLFIGGDLNDHVCTTNIGFEGVHGGFGYGDRNQEGKNIFDLAVGYRTFFRKSRSLLVTFSSAKNSCQINFVLTRIRARRACLVWIAM
jgi:hypothetical protein